LNKKTSSVIQHAVNTLHQKIKLLDVDRLGISAYNKKYFTTYIINYAFYMDLYTQLLEKAVTNLDKPIQNATFVDYGGGCGMLSYLAKEIGFKTVIYNDIYATSVNDTRIISDGLNIHVDHFVEGDVDAFIEQVDLLNLQPDVICSFDVLEHIYDWKTWIDTILKISNPFILIFMTSANGSNPFINRRLKRIQIQAEYEGFEHTESWKEIDISNSYLAERKKIISNAFPEIEKKDLEMLAVKTRGLKKDDIENLVVQFIKTGQIHYTIDHPTNTCDPYTGNWTEHIINIDELKRFVKAKNIETDVTNTSYGYGNSFPQNIIKFCLNVFIKILGKHNLMLSPVYVLEIYKQH